MLPETHHDGHVVPEADIKHQKVKTLQRLVCKVIDEHGRVSQALDQVFQRLAAGETVPLLNVQDMLRTHELLHGRILDVGALLLGQSLPAAAPSAPIAETAPKPATPVTERRTHKRMSKEEQLSQDLQDLKKPPQPADNGESDEGTGEATSGEAAVKDEAAKVVVEPASSPKVATQPQESWIEKGGLTELAGLGLESLTPDSDDYDFPEAELLKKHKARMARLEEELKEKAAARANNDKKDDEPPPQGDPPNGAPPSSPPPTSGPAGPPPSPPPTSQASPNQPNARLGIAPLAVVAGVVANPTPVKNLPKPPWTRKDDGIEYRPDVVPEIPLPFLLPEDWGRAPHKAPILHIAAIAGCTEIPKQLGLIGLRYKTDQPIAIDLDGCCALAFFGVPGYGKSYAMALPIEMALQQAGSINKLLSPQCAVVLHYHPSASYEPEMLASVYPNQDPREACKLVYHYRALPRGLPDLLVLTLPEQVKAMRQRHRHAQVHGIKFSLRDLGVDGLRILLGLDRSQKPLYMSQVQGLLKKLEAMGGELTFARLVDEIDQYPFRPWVKGILVERLRLVRDWIDDSRSIRDFVKPGRLIQIDIRSEWLPSEDAMVLFRLLTSALVMDPDRDNRCNLIVAYDEAHKFAKCLEVRRQMTTMVRERRHLRISLVLASQDPLSIPEEIIALLDGIGVFRHESSAWNKHLAKSCAALSYLKTSMTEALPAGMMWFWSRQWCMLDTSEGDFHHRPILVDTRPRLSHHGGATKKATEARAAVA